jgi:photosystem II stability/assembly factor-like uncharacterized protein
MTKTRIALLLTGAALLGACAATKSNLAKTSPESSPGAKGSYENYEQHEGTGLADWLPYDPAEDRPAIIPPDIRTLPASRSVFGGTAWVSRGPSPTESAQVRVPPDNEVSGAIHSIAAHPSDANIVFIGAVNGGIWRTGDALAARPTWTPLSEQLPSQSISAIVFDPTDASRRTLLAGTGRFSSLARRGDDEIGVYRTTDNGNTWTQLGATALVGQRLVAVVARGSTLFAASLAGGLFRSTDTGATWALVPTSSGLPAGGISTLVEDKSNINRLIIAVRTGQILRSDDAGATWINVTTGVTNITAASEVRLAFGPTPVVYASVANGGSLAGVFRSPDLGATWAAMDVPVVHPGGQASLHGALVAHPTNPNLVFVSGDRITASPFTGNVFRLNAGAALTTQGSSVVDGGANNTAPHADSRFMVFDAAGNLLQSDDGGIYRLSNADNASATWSSVIGNLNVTEIHSVAHNTLTDIVVIGTQDNGTHQQVAASNLRWRFINGGDGGDVAIDNEALGATGAYTYLSSQNLGGFRRRQTDPANTFIASLTFPAITDAQFVTPIELNPTNQRRLLVGGSTNLYEAVGAGSASTGTPPVYVTIAPSPPLLSGANQGALAYGAADDPNAIYAGKGAAVIKRAGAATTMSATAALPAGAATITDVGMNPQNSLRVAAIDNDQVFFSADGGTSWTDISFNIASVSSFDFRTVEFITGSMGEMLTLGTRSGVYILRAGETTWVRLGTGMPDVLVYDLRYVPSRQMLVAGTLGRGAWTFDLRDPNLLFKNGFE